MPPRFKVHPTESGSLCSRCSHGHVVERRNGAQAARCIAYGESVRVPMDIVRCSEFLDKNRSDKWEMEKIAWRIRHDKSGKIRGFEPPKKKDDE